MIAMPVPRWLPFSVLGGLMWGGWTVRQVLGGDTDPFPMIIGRLPR